MKIIQYFIIKPKALEHLGHHANDIIEVLMVNLCQFGCSKGCLAKDLVKHYFWMCLWQCFQRLALESVRGSEDHPNQCGRDHPICWGPE